MIVRPLIDAVTPGSTWNTRLALLPLTVTPAAGPVIVSVPVVSLSSSWAPVSVIVCALAKTVGSKVIVSVAAQGIGQVDRLAQVELARGRDQAVGGRVDHQRASLGLEGADVDRAVEREAALVGRDAAARCPRRWPGCRAAGPWSGSARRSCPAVRAEGRRYCSDDGILQIQRRRRSHSDPPLVLPLTVQLVSVAVPGIEVQHTAAAVAAVGGVAADGAVGQRGRAVMTLTRPPPLPAELPLTVQLVSVAVADTFDMPAACAGGVAADGAVGQRGRAEVGKPPPPSGGVAADGAVGQRGRADIVDRPPPLPLAELPLTVQLVSVAVP